MKQQKKELLEVLEMKRMELKICLTFVIMFVVAVIISGIYSVVSMNSSFFTYDVMIDGAVYAFVYVVCIWANTRRHQLLAWLGLFSIAFIILLVVSSVEGGSSAVFGTWNWKDTVYCIYCAIAYFVAMFQGIELLEEDEEAESYHCIN